MARQLKITQPFDLKLSLTMGQAFRWQERADGWFSGVLSENLIHIRQTDGGVEYRVGGPEGERSATDADDDLLRRYFREDDDVSAIYREISQDPVIEKLVSRYRGMRVLRQDPWECLVSYICSRSNSILSICQCVAEIATLSHRTVSLGGDVQYIFPKPERILEVGQEGLSELNLVGRFSRGFPAAIWDAAGRVRDGKLNFGEMRRRLYPDVVYGLMLGNGVGLKIANCVALMSLDKLNAFPVDTHIRRLVSNLWFGEGKSPSDARISQWAQQYFGSYAGYAGQFLFCDREQGGKTNAFGTLWGQVGHSAVEPQSAPTRNTLHYPNRGYSCSRRSAGAGKVCRSPGGYSYQIGHSERSPRS